MTQELLRLPPGEKLLLPYQARWLADRSPLKIGEKSRRVGLTWAEAADAVIEAARATGGRHHFYLGTGKEMAKEFIAAAAQWAVAFNHAASEIQEEVLHDRDSDILVYRMELASGNRIEALSSRPATLRGRQGNLTVDEAAHHDQLLEVLKAANPLMMWGGKVRVISTHNGAENPFNELILDSRAGKREYSVHRIALRDACREGLYRRICLVRGLTWSPETEERWIKSLLTGSMTREDADEEYMCVPKQGGGAYLPRTLVEACMGRRGSGPAVRGFRGVQRMARADAGRRDPRLVRGVDPSAVQSTGPDVSQRLRSGLREEGQPDVDRSGADPPEPGYGSPVCRGAAKRPLSPAGTGALLRGRGCPG